MGECKENSSNDFFFDMVKRWTVNDFFNPGIKAEVIWDMLLSDFIPEIICFKENGGSLDKIKEYRLLAKEFPIDNDSGRGLDNAKVDYLVLEKESKSIYLVELKTTNDSFDHEQYRRYRNYVENKEVPEDKTMGQKFYNGKMLWDFYIRILESNIKESYLQLSTRPSNYNKLNYRTHVKYVEQMKGILNDSILQKEGPTPNEIYKDYKKLIHCMERKLKEYEDYKINLVYISLHPMEEKCFESESKDCRTILIALNDKYDNEKDIKCAIEKALEQQGDKADKLECWKQLIEIIEEIMKKNENYHMYA